MISNEQLAQLQAMVTTLVADKGDADQKTAASNAADTAAAQAAATAAQAKLDEAQADAKATADLNDLQHFIDALAGGVAPAPAVPAPTT